MPLSLSLLPETSIPALVALEAAAVASWPYARAMVPPGTSRQLMFEEWVRRGFETDSTQTYLQVCEGETGEMVSAALWRFEPVGDGGRERRPVGGEGKKEGDRGDLDEAEARAEAFGAARREMWREFCEGWFADQPYASRFFLYCDENPQRGEEGSVKISSHNTLTQVRPDLQLLITHPAHRRRGAASQLIEWGTRRADERGLKSVLMASEAGHLLYLRHGFKVVKEVEMDLRPYGVEATELRRWMGIEA